MSELPSVEDTNGAESRLELLSIWNQNSPRVYICVILCFPLDNAFTKDAVEHLHICLRRLACERPLFASRLQAAGTSEPGLAHLIRQQGNEIPFNVSDASLDLGEDYNEIKEMGFPPGMFVKPRFGILGSINNKRDLLPVSRVHAVIHRGGLLLSVYLHHSLCDGDSLRIFLECLAAQTRGDTIDRPSAQAFEHACPIKRNGSFSSLMSSCPEYTILPECNGPTQPHMSGAGTPLGNIKKIGRIFVFKKERIAELRDTIHAYLQTEKAPSTYTCLAALTFAHVTKARLQTEDFLAPREGKDQDDARLWNSVNWRTRAYQHLTGDYFGNAALPAVTHIKKQQLFRACDDLAALAALVPRVKASIDAVDEDYVHRRLAMVSALPDPRLIGVNYDPRDSQCLAFNTWRHFGADAIWSIPGVPVSKPDAIRRAHGSWNLGTALIMPARIDSESQELFISLSRVAMEQLCQDEAWLKWVDKIIG